MDKALSYIKDNLGLALTAEKYAEAQSWPVFLARAADYSLCALGDIRCLVARVPGNPSLPELKRISGQSSRRADVPVVLVNERIDARQRKALVQQGIPFIVPDKQAYLPFLGFVASAAAKKRNLGECLSPSSQAALVVLFANGDVRTAVELRETMHATSSSVSRALDELAQRELIAKSKSGREVVISRNDAKNELLKAAMPYLSSPIVRKVFARRNSAIEALPDAGDSALAERSMLNRPAVMQKAIARNMMGELAFDEVLEGELDDADTAEIQVWFYDPLVAGSDGVDNVSLALSLVEEDDDRINGELDSLFDEEGLWQ